jgi:hypothetical protein
MVASQRPQHPGICSIRLLQMVGVRLLVIDELHNLLAGPHRVQRAVLNVIRQMANELRAPLLCLGTRVAREALLSDPQLVRRFESFELPRWQRGEEFYGLLNTLLRTLPLRKPSRLSLTRCWRRPTASPPTSSP